MLYAYVLRYLKIDPFLKKIKIQIVKNPHLGFLGSFDMLYLVLQANYGEKIGLMQIFSLVNPNAPGLNIIIIITRKNMFTLTLNWKQGRVSYVGRNGEWGNAHNYGTSIRTPWYTVRCTQVASAFAASTFHWQFIFSRSYCYTVWSAIGIILLSVCLSVCRSVTLCIVALSLMVGVHG